jgi:hypothetical protein
LCRRQDLPQGQEASVFKKLENAVSSSFWAGPRTEHPMPSGPRGEGRAPDGKMSEEEVLFLEKAELLQKLANLNAQVTFLSTLVSSAVLFFPARLHLFCRLPILCLAQVVVRKQFQEKDDWSIQGIVDEEPIVVKPTSSLERVVSPFTATLARFRRKGLELD